MKKTGTKTPFGKVTVVPPPRTGSTRQMEFGGVSVPLSKTRNKVDETNTAFYKKEYRDKLDVHQLNDLFVKAESSAQKKCDFIDIKVGDSVMLEDAYYLQIAINITKDKHARFDMHDIFNIVFA